MVPRGFFYLMDVLDLKLSPGISHRSENMQGSALTYGPDIYCKGPGAMYLHRRHSTQRILQELGFLLDTQPSPLESREAQLLTQMSACWCSHTLDPLGSTFLQGHLPNEIYLSLLPKVIGKHEYTPNSNLSMIPSSEHCELA